MDCHADKSARNDRKTAPSKKMDSSYNAPLSSQDDTALSPSLRADEIGVAIHKQQKQKGEKVDSKRNAKNPQSHNSTNATRRQDFGDKNGALQGESRAHTKAYVTADSPQQSPFLAQKPTPEPSQAQSSSPKPTPAQTDILTCLANLSSDEVFTPPHIVNAMLDLLPQELFSDPASTFLDPACKSGVFLREIARRLMLGARAALPRAKQAHSPYPYPPALWHSYHRAYRATLTPHTLWLKRCG